MVSQYSLYASIGGETAVAELVCEFYRVMDTSPEAAGIRAMHPQDLFGSIDKLSKFLCGFLGGPALYAENYGSPALRARHRPFNIGADERDQWLWCMQSAIDTTVTDQLLADQLMVSFGKMADHLRNSEDGSDVGVSDQ